MKGKQISLYIGSNNKTKILEDEKMMKILNKYLKGYTLDYTRGVWEGEQEESVVVEVINPPSQREMDRIASEIARKLKQDVVLRVSDEVSYRFVSSMDKVKKVV